MRTKHYAGAAEVSVGSGIQRVEEIVDGRSKAKYPTMTIYLNEELRFNGPKVDKFAKTLIDVRLEDISKLKEDLSENKISLEMMEEELEEISGKKIVGAREEITIFGPSKENHTTFAKIDTGAYRTTICQSIAHKLHLEDATRYKKVRSALGQEERKIINLRFKMDGILIETEAFIANREHMKCDIIIGRKDIKKFLVDPAKNVKLKSTA